MVLWELTQDETSSRTFREEGAAAVAYKLSTLATTGQLLLPFYTHPYLDIFHTKTRLSSPDDKK